MAKDPTSSQIATNALQGILFGNIIGAPLTAHAEAQAEQAKAAAKFMKEAGLDLDKEAEEKE
ncbi:hypothetical protein [Parabacteroides distasonis]|uniref:hypothetical protein n=1 Tax=Parabacteroides distasonis TaxID=823 RepID=UPI001F3AB0E5|nr:hypothetical protein [Parabacteroides distasonis]MCE9060380.1 hypothetical protein [Parabacteroides distasonis]